MKYTAQEKELLVDAIERHIDNLIAYCPDDADQRIEVAENLLCKLGVNKRIVNHGLTGSWVSYQRIEQTN